MWWRLLRADLRRNATVACTLALLVAVCAALAAASAGVTASSITAIDSFMRSANPPTVVQMHKPDDGARELDAAAIETWAAERNDVTDLQIIETLPASGQELWLNGENQGASVLEPAFVTPTDRFDLLLGSTGAPVAPAPGEVYMPVQHEIDRELRVGDEVRVGSGNSAVTLRVAGFIRDAQMGPTLVTSKRLVVNERDFATLQKQLAPEYLIEFELAPGADVTRFSTDYTASGLPRQGVLVDESIFTVMNGLSTFLVVAVVLVVAATLLLVALIALRLAVLSALTRDLRQITTLRAIGIPARTVRLVFLAKYCAIAVLAGAVGTAASFPLADRVGHATLQGVGQPPSAFPGVAAALITGAVVALLVALFAWTLMRGFMAQSIATALADHPTARRTKTRRAALTASRLDPHTWLALDAARRPVMLLLGAVVAVCTSIAMFPAAIGDTVTHPTFASYLGIGNADVIVDLEDPSMDAGPVHSTMMHRGDIDRAVVLDSHHLEVRAGSEWEDLIVQTGNHAAFPLTYREGTLPSGPRDVALSLISADDLNASVGDSVVLRVNGVKKDLRVSGIYQDITNGGRTAKVAFVVDGVPVWRVLHASVNSEDPSHTVTELARALPGTTVTDVADYSEQVMGSLSGQLRTAAVVAVGLALAVVALVASLVTVLTLVRDRDTIAALRSIGVSVRGVRRQYLTQVGVVIVAGVGIGVGAVLVGGKAIMGVAFGAFGAPAVAFLPSALAAWGIPALLAVTTVRGQFTSHCIVYPL